MFGFQARKHESKGDVFGAQDVERLLSIFPIPNDTAFGHVPLLQSKSSEYLVRSDFAHRRLSQLLSSGEQPINIAQIRLALDLSNTDPILESGRNDLIYNAAGTSLFSVPLQRRIKNDLVQKCSNGFVDTIKYCKQNDIQYKDLQRICRLLDGHDELLFFAIGGLDLATTKPHLDITNGTLLENMRAAHREAVIVNLQTEDSTLTPTILQSLATDALSQNHPSVPGKLEITGKDVRFTPESASMAKATAAQQQHRQLVDAVIARLRDDGYYMIVPAQISANDVESLLADIIGRFEKVHGEAVEKLAAPYEIYLITSSHLELVQNSLLPQNPELAKELWANRALDKDLSFDATTFASLAEASPDPDLAQTIISHPRHSAPIFDAFTLQMSALQAHTQTSLSTQSQIQLLAPTALYQNSLLLSRSATDTSLPDKLSEHLLSYFGTELLPPIINRLMTPETIPSKTVYAELQRLKTSVYDAKQIADIETALKRFTRKAKIDNPSPTTLRVAKTDFLERKVKAMTTMKRGSDGLQNLIWLLLACSPVKDITGNGKDAEALWVSSGKDTSRMIKFYKQVSTSTGQSQAQAWSKRIEEMRDLLKEGKDSKDLRTEMATIAASALEGWKQVTHESH